MHWQTSISKACAHKISIYNLRTISSTFFLSLKLFILMLPKTSLQQSVMVMRNIKDLKLLQQGKLTQAPERGSINNLKWESRFWPFLRFWPGEQWSTCSWTLSSSHSYWSRLPEIFSSLAHRADVSNALTWSDILMVMSSFVLNILHFILKEYKTYNKKMAFNRTTGRSVNL